MRIEIAAGLGVGKTWLCGQLSKRGYHVIYEDLQKNPFFDDFYTDMETYGFPFQMSFVLSKYTDFATKLSDSTPNIIDYAIVNGLSYASLAFKKDPAAMRLIESAYTYVSEKCGPPSLILYIRCPVDTQMKRVKSRNRDAEKNVARAYLEDYNKALNEQIRIAQYHGAKVIEIDDPSLSGLSNEDYVNTVEQRIKAAIKQPRYKKKPVPQPKGP